MIRLNDGRRRMDQRARQLIPALVVLVLLILNPSCDHQDPLVVTPLPPDLTISPASMELVVGQTGQFHASSGAWPGSPSIEWTSSDEALATVAANGLATAWAPGEVSIIVTLVGTEVRTAARLSIRAPPSRRGPDA
jgi:hypothetical protein